MWDSYALNILVLAFVDLKFRYHQVSICNFGRLLTTSAVSVYIVIRGDYGCSNLSTVAT
jgi:hypothetical protein